jgi:hypothetical protein
MLVVATLALLARASVRSAEERPRALGLIAILLSMLGIGVAVAVSRAGLGSSAILSSRYITLATPLLCVLYVAWLAYGNGPTRLAVHLGLIALICLASPSCREFSRGYGSHVRHVEAGVERSLRNHVPTAVLMRQVYPALHYDSQMVDRSLRMLKVARVGAFAELGEDRVVTAEGPAALTRR